jgi:hypothetical protein
MAAPMILRRVVQAIVVVAISMAMVPSAHAQGVVTVTTPASVTFTVPNVTVSTTGSPSAARVSYTFSLVLPTQVLRVSVRADAANFTSPATGTPIPSSKLTWTTNNVTNGTGTSGTLSTTYTTLYQANALQLSGGADVHWVLQPPGGGIRSGSHTLIVRYRFEAI